MVIRSAGQGFRLAEDFTPQSMEIVHKKRVRLREQSTGFYYKKKTGLPLWQVNHYEHVLGKEEDTTNVARYIINNPVRKGLVDDIKKYKSLGSFEFDLFTL